MERVRKSADSAVAVPQSWCLFWFQGHRGSRYRRHSVMKHCGLMWWPFPKSLLGECLGDLSPKILLVSKEEDTERFSSQHYDQHEYTGNKLNKSVNCFSAWIHPLSWPITVLDCAEFDFTSWTLPLNCELWTCFEHCERSLAAGHIMATSSRGVLAGLRSLVSKIGCWTVVPALRLCSLYAFLAFLRLAMFLHRWAESGLQSFFGKSHRSLSASVGRWTHRPQHEVWSLYDNSDAVCCSDLLCHAMPLLRLQLFESVTSDGPMRCGQSRLRWDVLWFSNPITTLFWIHSATMSINTDKHVGHPSKNFVPDFSQEWVCVWIVAS